MNPEIFREYDIRGTVGREITEETATLVSKALVQYLTQEGKTTGTIIVGHDNRLSSPELAKAAIKGIISTGWDVILIGTVPTPVYYYFLAKSKAEGGMMITASHNPPEFNGFKVNRGKDSLYGKQIKQLYTIIKNNSFPEGQGKLSSKNIIEQYIQDIQQRFIIQKPLKIVVDAGNGTAGAVAPQLLTNLGCEVIPLFCELNGNFPNHHPDPTVTNNLISLQKEIKEQHADFGVAFDGDSDRIGVVDEHGTIIWGDRLLALFAKDLLSRHPKATIIFEVKCSLALSETITKAGGNPIMYKAGHSLIKQKMRNTGALLAGEMSGHMFFSENYFGYDDAIFAAALLCQILSKSNSTLSEIMKDIPSYPSSPEIRIDCQENKKSEVINRMFDSFKNDYEIIDVDGVRVIFENGWGLIRASNTQPILVLRFEAKSDEALQKIVNIFKEEISKISFLDASQIAF